MTGVRTIGYFATTAVLFTARC